MKNKEKTFAFFVFLELILPRNPGSTYDRRGIISLTSFHSPLAKNVLLGYYSVQSPKHLSGQFPLPSRLSFSFLFSSVRQLCAGHSPDAFCCQGDHTLGSHKPHATLHTVLAYQAEVRDLLAPFAWVCSSAACPVRPTELREPSWHRVPIPSLRPVSSLHTISAVRPAPHLFWFILCSQVTPAKHL